MSKDTELSIKLGEVQDLIERNNTDRKILLEKRNIIIKQLKRAGWSAIRIAKHIGMTRDFVYKAIDTVEEE
tara:strand:- start:217 stop:429 length:213 start_codon:yes stop_codon:yes gene_type:complete